MTPTLNGAASSARTVDLPTDRAPWREHGGLGHPLASDCQHSAIDESKVHDWQTSGLLRIFCSCVANVWQTDCEMLGQVLGAVATRPMADACFLKVLRDEQPTSGLPVELLGLAIGLSRDQNVHDGREPRRNRFVQRRAKGGRVLDIIALAAKSLAYLLVTSGAR